VTLQTEYEFFLPKGFVDDAGTVHRKGTMRLATARDELEPLRDPRVRDADDPFLTIIVLSRVVTSLGSIGTITPREIESLFAADLAYLQDFYGVINFGSPNDVADILDDAEARLVEAIELARSVERERERARAASKSAARRPNPVVVDDEDGDDGDGAGVAGAIDADALAARLQARWGDTSGDADDESDEVPVVASPKRARVEELGSRSG
jgi:hypothetical protein